MKYAAPLTRSIIARRRSYVVEQTGRRAAFRPRISVRRTVAFAHEAVEFFLVLGAAQLAQIIVELLQRLVELAALFLEPFQLLLAPFVEGDVARAAGAVVPGVPSARWEREIRSLPDGGRTNRYH